MNDKNIFGSPVRWRSSMLMPRIFIFDARIVASLALVIFHLRWWTASILLANIVLFWLIERYGYRFPSAFRALRSFLAGNVRFARQRSRYRQLVDYGFEAHPFTAHRMAARYATLEQTRRARLRREGREAAKGNAPSSAIMQPRTAP